MCEVVFVAFNLDAPDDGRPRPWALRASLLAVSPAAVFFGRDAKELV
jgi:hypothetical protein